MHNWVTRGLGGKHCAGVKCNSHGVDIPFFNVLFVISLPSIQTRVFRASPYFSPNDVDRRSLHS